MIQQLKLVIRNRRNFIRIISYILISIILLFVTWLVDYSFPHFKAYFPSFFFLSIDVSTSLLSNLSGVFLTVTTFTFTTILTILNYYSNNFTPRIVQDFIEKPNVLSLFGILIGGFFYTILSLFLLQNISQDIDVIAGTIAIFYTIFSMLAFILFVQRVLRDIKTDNVIDSIYKQAIELVEVEAKKRKNSKRYFEGRLDEGISIYGQTTGYFYDIDYNRLMSHLSDMKAELVITRKIGEYIPRGMYIASLILEDNHQLDETKKLKLLENISSSLIMNTVKNEHQDYHFEITNLVEIALKALSPGINDPNTAIICINKISLLLGQLFSSKNDFITLASDDNTKIIYKTYSVEEELYLSFNQILFYAKGEPTVGRAILENIYLIYMISDQSTQKDVEVFFEYVYSICYKALEYELDKKKLTLIKNDFELNRDKHSDRRVLRNSN